MTAVSSSMIHIQQPVPRVKIQDQSDEDIYDDCHNSNSRDASNSSPNYHPENDLENLRNNQENSPQIEPNRQLQTSAFAMQNVLKVKTEREATSPESQNVFSTEKLMENTPTCDAEKPQDYNATSPDFRNDSRNSLPTPSPRYDLNSPENSDRPYSNPNSVRVEINVDDESCCSEDTVLSVGNEAPVAYNTPSETSQKSQGSSPGLSPSNQGLTSFKHIQTHLNAISQLSHNLNIAQPLLLRPNPVAPNPLIFLNQPHLLFQNPLLNQIDAKHTNIPPRVPQPNIPPNALSANSPSGLSFGHLNQFNIRHLKQNGVQSSSQDLRNSRPTDENRRLNIFNPKSPSFDDERRELILNQNCLKFSIDNILKADFGRRITDPLFKRKTSKARQSSLFSETPKTVPPKDFSNVKAVQKPSDPRPLDVRPPEPRVPEAEKTEKAGAIDLSKSDEGTSSTPSVGSGSGDPMVWPAWVYCTRYSDRPSSDSRCRFEGTACPTECVDCPGPRTRRPKKPPGERSPAADEKRPRTAFSGPQLARLKHEFAENRYLTERRRQQLAAELGLAEAQIKIWFQNKRAKIKKASGQRNPLALQLMAQGLYNHSTVPLTREEEELQELQAREAREKQGR